MAVQERVACVRIPRFPIGAVWLGATPRGAANAPAAAPAPHWDEQPIALRDGPRLRAVTAAAARTHVRAGMTIAEAKSRCAGLDVRAWDDVCVSRELARTSAAFLAASPQVASANGTPGTWWIGATGFDGLGGECALADTLQRMARVWHPYARVAIADSDVPNAFATGRSPNSAVVCATTGLMRRLDEAELEAVLAHELSHVAHRDVAVMTIASFLGVVAGLITRIMFWTGMMGGFGGSNNSNNNNSNDNAALVEMAVLVVSVVVYAISFLLTRALSRYRELAADRSGALLTGQPSALASALVKVTGEMSRIPTRDLRAAESFNAFYFTPAIATKGVSLSTIFSTHPTLEKRLDQLAKIEAELGRPV